MSEPYKCRVCGNHLFRVNTMALGAAIGHGVVVICIDCDYTGCGASLVAAFESISSAIPAIASGCSAGVHQWVEPHPASTNVARCSICGLTR